MIDVKVPAVCRESAQQVVMVPSHDGVPVPLSIIHKKGLKKDGEDPVLLMGYGSYGASLKPYFRSYYGPLLERGGILAIAHVRGGGEFGEVWRLAGYQKTKPNTWKYFIACAEHLVRENSGSIVRGIPAVGPAAALAGCSPALHFPILNGSRVE